MLLRLGATFVLIISILFFPWWLNFILFFVFVFSFSNFYEAAISAFLFDVLRHRPETIWLSLFTTLVVIMVVYLSGMVKKQIIFYHQ
ncbi:MAG: hypothetical protein WC893_03145 [Candidatus Paceibacterota bacterium]|jgi:hypothetical protein